MSIDYDGGIYLGAWGDDIIFDKDKYKSLYDFVEDNDLDVASPYYDSPLEECFIGAELDNGIYLYELDDFTNHIYNKIAEINLDKILKVPLQIVGMQNIT
jgi:hypothetical protein